MQRIYINSLVYISIGIVLSLFSLAFAAAPVSETYSLSEYGFGAGGIATSSSETYGLLGTVGETDVSSMSSETFNVKAGLTYTHMANVPNAPTLTNVSSTYDRLQITLNTGGNPTDTKFAIAISSDNFASTQYVQSDGTIGSVLGIEDYLTYTGWGGASGSYISGLLQNTTYKVKVKAKQGNFTDSGYSPIASATTSLPTLTFGVDASTVTFSNLNSGNSYTDSAKTTVLTTSTNAYNGYVVNARVTGVLTKNGGSETISSYTSPNSAPTTWSGTGFGYTTSDASLTGGTVDRFTNGGTKYAGFTTSSPGDPVADHAGPVVGAISGEQFTVSYRVTAPTTQAAGVYSTTVLYMVAPEY